MKATKIKMKPGCGSSNNLTEIHSVYITGCESEGFYAKEVLHDHLKQHPNTIQVNISPYPDLLPAVSSLNEKYVKSEPNPYKHDNLLELPRV